MGAVVIESDLCEHPAGVAPGAVFLIDDVVLVRVRRDKSADRLEWFAVDPRFFFEIYIPDVSSYNVLAFGLPVIMLIRTFRRR
jgi:hypothetical protein